MAKISRKGNKTTVIENNHLNTEQNANTEKTNSILSIGKAIAIASGIAAILISLANCLKKKPNTQDNNPYDNDDKPDGGDSGTGITPDEQGMPKKTTSEDNQEGATPTKPNKDDDSNKTTTNIYKGRTRYSISPEKKDKDTTKVSKKKGKGENDDIEHNEQDSLEIFNSDDSKDSNTGDYIKYSLGAAGVATLGFAIYSGDLETIGSTLLQVSGNIPNIFDIHYEAIF